MRLEAGDHPNVIGDDVLSIEDVKVDMIIQKHLKRYTVVCLEKSLDDNWLSFLEKQQKERKKNDININSDIHLI